SPPPPRAPARQGPFPDRAAGSDGRSPAGERGFGEPAPDGHRAAPGPRATCTRTAQTRARRAAGPEAPAARARAAARPQAARGRDPRRVLRLRHVPRRCCAPLSPSSPNEPTMQLALTEKQILVLRFYRDYRRQHGIAPTLEEAARALGVSKITIHEHLRHLEAKGAVQRDRAKARSVAILFDPDAEEHPERPEPQLPLL